MKEISQYNMNTHEYEVMSGIDPAMPVSFVTDLGRYEVVINDDGGIDISGRGYPVTNDRVTVKPHAANRVSVVLERRQ